MNRRSFLTAGAGSLLASCSGAAHRRLPRSEKLRIVFFTDVHAGPEQHIAAELERAARAIRAVRADVLIGGGDFISEGFTSCPEQLRPRWEAYRLFQQALAQHVYPVIGNHDLEAVRTQGCAPAADPKQHFRDFFGLSTTHYSFETGGHTFFVLDSVEPVIHSDDYAGHVSDAQLKWLRAELDNIPGDRPLVLVSHLPLLTALFQATEGGTAAAPPNRVVTNNREVLDLFSAHSLRIVLQGHLHVEEQIRWRGTEFINGGAICGGWWHGAWHGTPPGFGILTLSGSGIDWHYQAY